MSTLYVKNQIQKIIFDCEMREQISDGFWENASPMNHWRPWGNCKVAISSDKFGRDFRSNKDNYNFANKELLEIVGDRLIFRIKAHIFLGWSSDRLGNDFVDSVEDYDRIVSDISESDYWQKLFYSLQDRGIDRNILEQIDKVNYDISDLRKDIKVLRQACKTFIKN